MRREAIKALQGEATGGGGDRGGGDRTGQDRDREEARCENRARGSLAPAQREGCGGWAAMGTHSAHLSQLFIQLRGLRRAGHLCGRQLGLLDHEPGMWRKRDGSERALRGLRD